MADETRARRRAVRWASRIAPIASVVGAAALWGASPAAASPCSQATISWDGGAGTTSWITAANWTGDRLPNAEDQVCIPAGAPGASVVHSGTTTIKSLEARKPLTLSGSLALTSTSVASLMTEGTISGTLNGPGELHISGTVNWGSGEMKTFGTTRVLAGARLNVTNQSCCARAIGSNYTLVNDGTLAIEGDQTLNLGENFQLQNNGLLTWAPTGYAALADSSAQTAIKPLIANAGTIVKTTGAEKTIMVAVWNKPSGIVRSDSGTLKLQKPSSNPSSGTFAGGVVLSGSHVLSNATFTGVGNKIGTTSLPQGTTTTIASGSTTLWGNVDGPGRLLVQGTLDWTAGEMKSSAVTEIAPSGRLNLSAACCSSWSAGSNASILNNGTLSYSGEYGINFGDNFRIQNNGTLEFMPGTYGAFNDASAPGAIKPSITNAGTIVKSGVGDKSIFLPLWNQSGGVVKSNGGTVVFQRGSGGNPSSGIFAGGVGLSGSHVLSGATFTGTGNRIGTASLPQGTTTTIASGSTALVGNVDGPGRLLVQGTLDWTGGEMKSSVVTKIASGGHLNLYQGCCSNRPIGSNATIVNEGTMVIASGEGVNLGDAFEIYNDGRLEWAPGPYSDILDTSTTTKPLISNAGTFVKQGTQSGPLNVPMENEGTIEVEAGALLVNGRFKSFSKTRGILKEGDYVLKGALRVANMSASGVVRNAARITLDGTAAALTDHASTNALRGLTRNAGGGRLTLRNGATLATLGALRNAGKVTVEAGSTLTTAGYTQVRGATVVDAPTSNLRVGTTPGLDLVAGSLRGSGVVHGNVTNSGGSVMPGGAAPGQLSFQGTFTQTALGSLDLDVGGLGSYDSLAVSGAATLGGRLGLVSSSTYAPTLGDSFTFLTYASQTGAFASFPGSELSSGLTYAFHLQPQSTTAVVQ